jgi:DNA-binding transcriptional regulator YdaS (Cro superfamily)
MKTVDQVVEAAGGETTLAAALNVSRQAVNKWRRIPVERVLHIEALTKIPRHEIRPDIYPPPGK